MYHGEFKIYDLSNQEEIRKYIRENTDVLIMTELLKHDIEFGKIVILNSIPNN